MESNSTFSFKEVYSFSCDVNLDVTFEKIKAHVELYHISSSNHEQKWRW
jgi:hypothetical protein